MKTNTTQKEQIDLCLDHETWTGLSVRELAKAGRLVVREGQCKRNLQDLVDAVIGEIRLLERETLYFEASRENLKRQLDDRRDLVDAIARKTVDLYESNYATK